MPEHTLDMIADDSVRAVAADRASVVVPEDLILTSHGAL